MNMNGVLQKKKPMKALSRFNLRKFLILGGA